MRFLAEGGVENSAFAFQNLFFRLTYDLCLGYFRHIGTIDFLIKWNSMGALLPGDRFTYHVRVDHWHSQALPKLSRQGRFAAAGQAAYNHKERFQGQPSET